ncbi:hypothetical protein BDA96_09G076500 [Sorghum bicolor]|uniref:Uncharacterized protein n=2 Tax=Sorghum bicolor TaxID=4558 RepID=A0A921Q984_SORBI|nr:hypothetical protein BDA96_09G076500 [Sorghum bicolor]OQU77589.1 hypothetical protein SORBI_3009G072300 [Sorghum bicolor]
MSLHVQRVTRNPISSTQFLLKTPRRSLETESASPRKAKGTSRGGEDNSSSDVRPISLTRRYVDPVRSHARVWAREGTMTAAMVTEAMARNTLAEALSAVVGGVEQHVDRYPSSRIYSTFLDLYMMA